MRGHRQCMKGGEREFEVMLQCLGDPRVGAKSCSVCGQVKR